MAESAPTLAVSNTVISDFRRCEQLYSYRYVDRLRRKDRAPAPELGTMLHSYFELYYQALKDGSDPATAHGESQMAVSSKYMPEIKRFANAAHIGGADDLATDLLALPKVVGRISSRYYAARGKADASRHKVLLVEEFANIEITKGIVSNARIDLVTEEQERGLIWLWEHKSTKDIPDVNWRLRDQQTPLYARKLEQLELCPPIDAVLWNYVRTKEPTAPEVGKRGEPTKRANLDSTWPTYLKVIEELGLNPADFDDVRRRLEPRELAEFFPRFEQPIVSEVDLLFRDYVRTAKDIRLRRKQWAAKARRPVRSLARECGFCDFHSLCLAAIMTGSDRDVRLQRFIAGT